METLHDASSFKGLSRNLVFPKIECLFPFVHFWTKGGIFSPQNKMSKSPLYNLPRCGHWEWGEGRWHGPFAFWNISVCVRSTQILFDAIHTCCNACFVHGWLYFLEILSSMLSWKYPCLKVPVRYTTRMTEYRAHPLAAESQPWATR